MQVLCSGVRCMKKKEAEKKKLPTNLSSQGHFQLRD